MLLRSELHSRGLRFRVDFPIRVTGRRPIRPDVVFTRRRVAVFVDGCFWHGCPAHGSTPKSNTGYWLPKLRRTQERDRETERALREAGWLVLRVWEHEPVSAAGDRITELVLTRRP
jgi:DNA mismatch endonuclease (patch repair protein)